MRKFVASSVIATLLAFLTPAYAESDLSISIPEKVTANILKRHPGAHEMSAKEETHFGQKLLEVSFKDETGQEILELFTAKGHIFTRVSKTEGLYGVSVSAVERLNQEFPKHTLQRTEVIVNPNGAGEEYDIYLHANGHDWNVCINHKGELKEKQQLTP